MQLNYKGLKNEDLNKKSEGDALTKITELSSRIFNVPISLLTSKVIGNQWWYSQNDETALINEYSTLIPDLNEFVVINDTLNDDFFNTNQLVERYNIRFFVGIPIFSESKERLGILVLLDKQPRTLSTEEIKTLTNLAEIMAVNMINIIELEKNSYQEQSLYDFLQISNSSTLSFHEKVEHLLELGSKRFNYGNDVKHLVASVLEDLPGSLEESLIKTFSSNFTLSRTDLEFIKNMAQWIGYSLEQIDIEKERIERIELFQQITENSREAFWIYDIKKNQVLYTSQSWQEIWGRSNSEYHQNPCLWDESLHPEDRNQIIVRLKELKESSEFEYRIIKPDGGIYWIRDRIIPLFDKWGTLYRIAGIAEDITESRLNEDLLRKSDKLAAVGQLAASFAHEIRNPLTSIKGFIQLKRESIGTYSSIILSELGRIELIVNEFLMLAKPHQEIKFEKVDVKTIIRDVILLLEPQALLNDIELQIDVSDESQFVFCEPFQIKQVLINIVSNAIESMHSGGSVHIKLDEVQDEHIFIEIQDEGIGITEDRLARLGEPFYSNKEKGTGLGLMVSYKIIENHKGKIEINSEVNKGTNVKIFLPVESQ